MIVTLRLRHYIPPDFPFKSFFPNQKCSSRPIQRFFFLLSMFYLACQVKRQKEEKYFWTFNGYKEGVWIRTSGVFDCDRWHAGKCQGSGSRRLNYVTHSRNQLTRMSLRIHTHTSARLHQTSWANWTFSLDRSDAYCLRRDEYIMGPFSVNNMAAPTRYAALAYRFHLDEQRVGAALVQNLNTSHEIEKGMERWRDGGGERGWVGGGGGGG